MIAKKHNPDLRKSPALQHELELTLRLPVDTQIAHVMEKFLHAQLDVGDPSGQIPVILSEKLRCLVTWISGYLMRFHQQTAALVSFLACDK